MAQKVHPIWQPTCEETHSVERTWPFRTSPVSGLASRVSYCMTTASIRKPSCSLRSSFTVAPSSERCTASSELVNLQKYRSKHAIADFGKSGASCQVASGLRMRKLSSLVAWCSGLPTPAYSSAACRAGRSHTDCGLNFLAFGMPIKTRAEGCLGLLEPSASAKEQLGMHNSTSRDNGR